MNEQLLLVLISAIIGGFVGALFSAYVPRLLYGPRIRILGIENLQSSNTFNIVVSNRGATAAINAVGRITIRPIVADSIVIAKQQALDARKGTKGDWTKTSYWRRTLDSFLYTDDWQIGIEAENVFWATNPNPVQLNINPNLPERLLIAYSNGPWIDIASETPKIRRARLKLTSSTTYFGQIIVGAENCNPSKPFRFQIMLGPKGEAVIQEFRGTFQKQYKDM